MSVCLDLKYKTPDLLCVVSCNHHYHNAINFFCRCNFKKQQMKTILAPSGYPTISPHLKNPTSIVGGDDDDGFYDES